LSAAESRLHCNPVRRFVRRKPAPESNLVLNENSEAPQQTHLKRPDASRD